MCLELNRDFFIYPCATLCDLCETLCNPLVFLESYTEFHKDHTELHGVNINNQTIINYY